KTIAFVHAPVTGHTILPILACKEVVMSPDARLGPVLQGGEQLEESFRANYKIVSDGRNLFWAPVLKMLDANAEVLEGTRNAAQVFFTREEADRERGKPGVQVKNEPSLRAGATA